MDVDDEAPPLLVDVGASGDGEVEEEEKPVKVPITIVTGEHYQI